MESPRLNAEHLLAHVLGRKRIELYLEFERPLAETELAPLRDLVRRRGQGEPLQHLLGTVEFCGMTFLCDKRALVPRPETEELVTLLQSKIENRTSKILDVGTGSGVIALALAARFPEATVHALDLSHDALALARENAARLGLTDRVQFEQGDLLPAGTDRYDVIVANLPYVPANDPVSREVAHDPATALYGGATGTEVIQRLIESAPPRLAPGGLLALEIGQGQAAALEELLRAAGYHDISTVKDFGGILRFLFSRYG